MINKEINIMKNITLSKDTANKVSEFAKKTKRSFSSQAAYILDKAVELSEAGIDINESTIEDIKAFFAAKR